MALSGTRWNRLLASCTGVELLLRVFPVTGNSDHLLLLGVINVLFCAVPLNRLVSAEALPFVIALVLEFESFLSLAVL